MQSQSMCECCGKALVPKQNPIVAHKTDGTPIDALRELCGMVGNMIYDSVCEDARCQKYAQYQCDEFDAARKGE